MSGNSKSEKVEAFVRECVDRAIKDALYRIDDRDARAYIRNAAEEIKINSGYYASRKYGLMELNDIMHWKKPKDI